jgi:hypothetical protein
METFLRRNFKVEGNIASIYKPAETELTKLIEGIEVQLWHKAPMEKIFLANGFTNTDGDFTIEFEINSPVGYIVDGKISDVFLDAYYNGIKLEKRDSEELLEGLVAYWKLDETSGTTATDATSNGHTGEFDGSFPPTWISGKINNGIMINGSPDGDQDSFLNVSGSDDFDFGAGDFTYAFWMKPGNTSGKYSPINTGYPSAGSFLIEFTIADDTVGLYIGGSGAYLKPVIITPGTWYHVVTRRIGTQLEMFFNGTSLDPVTFTGNVACPSILRIGTFGSAQTIDGVMDEIGVWKGHGLTDAEIIKLYNEGDGLQYPF